MTPWLSAFLAIALILVTLLAYWGWASLWVKLENTWFSFAMCLLPLLIAIYLFLVWRISA